ncbi:GNAT family N-acetyltransferase [Halorientalis pallida]|uniref:GNAT family N-acetyltransferase n=1 Tax=Halorientalis pallida TaxID=2479928 RepID=UPI003C6EAE43
MDVRELTAESERRAAVPILRQLWRDESPEDVLAWTGEDEYRLFGGFLGDDLICVAGVLEQRHLHHERHAWLYDLVVDEPHRGAGHGRSMVEFVEEWAEKQGCVSISLASPLDKEGVHEFYERLDYDEWGYVIEKRL